MKKISISNSILWAAAIIASALLGSPWLLWGLLLPTLAYFAIIHTQPKDNCL